MESHHVERTVYEYGNSQLVYSLSGEIIQALRKHFPDTPIRGLWGNPFTHCQL